MFKFDEIEAQISSNSLSKKSNFCKYMYPNRGGYMVKPSVMEFWQGQTNRLHDRIVFSRPRDGASEPGELQHAAEGGWVYQRLSP